MTVERARVLSHRIIEVPAGQTTIEVPLDASHLPNVFLSVVLIRPSGASGPAALAMGLIQLPVSAESQQLNVTLTPDRPQAGPGEEVIYQVKATDAQGKPVQAEFALVQIRPAKEKKLPLSVGLLANAADVVPKIASGALLPDIVTDQTSAHDTLNGYVPAGMPYAEALALRRKDPKTYVELSRASIVKHVKGLLKLRDRGSIVFDYGTTSGGRHRPMVSSGRLTSQASSYPAAVL